MPFGLRNASQTFQRFIDNVFRGLDCTYVYIDDVLIASKTPTEHLTHLRSVFQRLEQYNIIINPSKSAFGLSEITVLGHQVNHRGISALRDKVRAIDNFPLPTDQRTLRTFLGLVSVYHRFLRRCAHILKPLNDLLSVKTTTLDWTPAAKQSFINIKQALATVTLLSHPHEDAPINIMTDASYVAIGAVIQQLVEGVWQPLGYFSRTLNPTERRYSTFDRELLAIYSSINHIRHFVEGRKFHIITDHKPLSFL